MKVEEKVYSEEDISFDEEEECEEEECEISCDKEVNSEKIEEEDNEKLLLDDEEDEMANARALLNKSRSNLKNQINEEKTAIEEDEVDTVLDEGNDNPFDEIKKVDETCRGIIYFPSLPPFMRPQKLRHLMEQYGEVGRLYCRPEDQGEGKRRQRLGGNRKTKYIDAWVEFMCKRRAKRVAQNLNSTSIGGKKRNYYRDDIWCMRYLSKFKWSQLREDELYQRQVRKVKLDQSAAKMRKENEYYLDQVATAKQKDKMNQRRNKQLKTVNDDQEEEKKKRSFPSNNNDIRDQPLSKRSKSNTLNENLLNSLF